MKFTQLSRYDPELVADIRIRMSLFVAGLSRLSTIKGRTTSLIKYMDISWLMVHVHLVLEEKLRDRWEIKIRGLRQGIRRDNKREILTDHI